MKIGGCLGNCSEIPNSSNGRRSRLPNPTQYSVPSKLTQEDLLRLLKNSGGVKTANGGVNRNCVAE